MVVFHAMSHSSIPYICISLVFGLCISYHSHIMDHNSYVPQRLVPSFCFSFFFFSFSFLFFSFLFFSFLFFSLFYFIFLLFFFFFWGGGCLETSVK